jgi:membrane-bound lytic murein transglycosylase B
MLEEETEPSYWVVFNNWYVLTRYNAAACTLPRCGSWLRK